MSSASQDLRSNRELSQITLIIPTVSRPHAVRRQFQYWRDTEVQVLILDGAPQAMHLTESELETKNVRYVHTGTRFNERLATAGQLVSTPYSALLPDDEFFLKHGLIECVRYLERVPESIGCTGRALGFFVDQGRFMTFPMYEDWKRFPQDATDVISRLDFALPPNKAHKVQFCLFRSAVWEEIFRESYEHFYSCGYVYERILNLYAAILGRTEILDTVVWMRSLENPPLSTVNVPRTGGRDFVSWSRDPEFAHELDHLRAKTRYLLGKANDLSTDEIESFAERFVEGGVRRQATKEQRNRRKVHLRFGALLVRKMPTGPKQLAKRYLPNRWLRFTGWQGFSMEASVKNLEAKGLSVSKDDLIEVQALASKTSQSQ